MFDTDTDESPMREQIEHFDSMDWIQQTRYAADMAKLHPVVARHIAKHGDPAARMALALRSDLPSSVRSILRRDTNQQVRENLLLHRNENGLAVGA